MKMQQQQPRKAIKCDEVEFAATPGGNQLKRAFLQEQKQDCARQDQLC